MKDVYFILSSRYLQMADQMLMLKVNIDTMFIFFLIGKEKNELNLSRNC